MNILVLNWRDPKHPSSGGAEIATLEHAKGWFKAGHEVYWISSYYKGAKLDEDIEGVKIIRMGGQYFGVQIKALLWYLLSKHPRFEVVIDQFHGMPFFTPLYVRARKLAFIHEVAQEVWTLNPWPSPFNLIPAVIGKKFEPLVFKIYKKVPFMTVSESTKKDLIRWSIPASNIFVIPNGINKNDKHRKFDKEPLFTAVYLGALSEDKGTEDAVKAFAEIERKDDRWQYWVIGNGKKDFVKKLKILSEKLEIRKKIRFYGYVSNIKKYELLSKAHILINTSYHEGWGLVNIEANSVGTPVIGYNVGGTKDSVKNGITGLLVEKANYRLLAESAVKLVKDKETYTKYQKNGIKWAAKFSWENTQKMSINLIESL